MIRPNFLVPGDKIGITAPGRKVSPADVEIAMAQFESWGLHPVTSRHLFSTGHSYLAGTDAQRLHDFQTMLDDDSVRAVICARGGYGSTRIIDQLDFTAFQKNPKWIAGFSDITAVLLKLSTLGFQGLHSTMPILFSKPDAAPSVLSLKDALSGHFHPLYAAPHPCNHRGKASGQLVGGNLSLVADAIGTPGEPDMQGKILVIEEIEEYRYKIDRMIVHLKRAGKLRGLAGLVVGHMTDILDTELSFGESVEEVIRSHTRAFDFPVGFGFPTGHANPNIAWPHGALAELNVAEDRSTLLIH
ncbi:MAG TPA: LD-carboxypeptidase [Ohtaekwangia sp.]|nr:LD-carboxypeptidase [Ohtaekwangia sp.]